MDEALFRRAKLEAVRQGRTLTQILGEALARYLDEGPNRGLRTHRTVGESWGALAAPPELVRQILEEEDGPLDA
jgi:hypothetical protein